MAVWIDEAPRKNCWNVEAQCYGICHGCGCCARDPVERYKNRIRLLEAELDDNVNFDQWFYDNQELMALQKRNVESNIRAIQKKLEWHKQKLKELGVEKDG